MFCSSVKKNSCTCCGRKTNLLCSSGYRHDDPQIWIQKINFLIYKFVVAIIGCQKQTFCVVYNLPKGCVLWSELLIHLFNLWKQDANLGINKYKHKISFGNNVSCKLAVEIRKFLLQVLAIWNWILSVVNSSNAFPGKYWFLPRRSKFIN